MCRLLRRSQGSNIINFHGVLSPQVSGYYEAEREVKSQIQAHGLQGQGMIERMWYMQEAIEVMGIVQFLHSLPKGKAIWVCQEYNPRD